VNRTVNEGRVALVRTDVSEERIASIISVLRFLVTANVVPSLPILVTLMIEQICSSETSVIAGATRCNIPEDGITHSHCSEDLKYYIEQRIYIVMKLVFKYRFIVDVGL
jgi:hypothetical protein